MSQDEFSLIERWFRRDVAAAPAAVLGIGDDAALMQVPAGHELVTAVDTLVEGVHFARDCRAADIGYKALAVNLSDLAAMGAEPAWATLALTLPAADQDWLRGFSDGFFELAARAGVQLVGGDTTRGPLTVTVQVHGLVPAGQALRRSGAQAGDAIWVTGCLGDAALAFKRGLREGQAALRLHRPEPRLAVGLALRGLASAAIDVSDGLLADLSHLLRASGLAATLLVDRLPRSRDFHALVGVQDSDWFDLPLAGGDDYELCFTAPVVNEERLGQSGLDCTRIGEVSGGDGVRCLHDDGREHVAASAGYKHFETGTPA